MEQDERRQLSEMIILGHFGPRTAPCFVNFVRVLSCSPSLLYGFFFLSEQESGIQQDEWLQPMRAMIHPLWVSRRTLTHLSRWGIHSRGRSADRGWQRLPGVLDTRSSPLCWSACNFTDVKLRPEATANCSPQSQSNLVKLMQRKYLKKIYDLCWI